MTETTTIDETTATTQAQDAPAAAVDVTQAQTQAQADKAATSQADPTAKQALETTGAEAADNAAQPIDEETLRAARLRGYSEQEVAEMTSRPEAKKFLDALVADSHKLARQYGKVGQRMQQVEAELAAARAKPGRNQPAADAGDGPDADLDPLLVDPGIAKVITNMQKKIDRLEAERSTHVDPQAQADQAAFITAADSFFQGIDGYGGNVSTAAMNRGSEAYERRYTVSRQAEAMRMAAADAGNDMSWKDAFAFALQVTDRAAYDQLTQRNRQQKAAATNATAIHRPTRTMPKAATKADKINQGFDAWEAKTGMKW